MRVLVIGRRGQLADALQRAPWPAGTQVLARGRDELNVADAGAVARNIAASQPDILINASGYTAVDRAESEPDLAFAVNRDGVRHLAVAARAHGIPLIQISTDYVFDGRGTRPWREDDTPNPIGVYARSKYAGERAIAELVPKHIVLRTSWLFAAQGQNFVRTMLRLAAERDRLRVVRDQIGCPTAARDLARVIAELAAGLVAGRHESGLYHYAGAEPTSWFDFAATIFDMAGDLVARRPAVEPITTAELGAPAPRPAYSVLDCSKIARDLGIAAPSWRDGLRAVLAEIRRGT